MRFDIKQLSSVTQKALRRNSPIIMMGIGIGGFITAGISIGTNTPKALQLIEAKKKELDVEQLTPVETVRTVWICYLPAATLMAISAACVIAGQSISMRRNAMLATAYTLAENSFKEYKEKVIDTIGEKKEREVSDEVAKERARVIPSSDESKVINTGKGTTLCFEPLSGRFFRSDGDHIRKAKNNLSEKVLKDGYSSVNDFYELLGLKETIMGDEFGWHVQGGLPEVMLVSDVNECDEPYLIIDYVIAPSYGYDM